MPQFEVHFLWGVNARSAQNGEAAGGELGDDYVITPAGAVADQEVTSAVPPHHHTNVRGVRVQGQVTGQGVGLAHFRQIYPHIPMPIAG